MPDRYRGMKVGTKQTVRACYYMIYHIFHANGNFTVGVKRTIATAHNIWAVAIMKHFKFLGNLVSNLRFHFQMNQL